MRYNPATRELSRHEGLPIHSITFDSFIFRHTTPQKLPVHLSQLLMYFKKLSAQYDTTFPLKLSAQYGTTFP